MNRLHLSKIILAIVVGILSIGCNSKNEGTTVQPLIQGGSSINMDECEEQDLDTVRPSLDIVDTHHAAELIAGIPRDATIIGRWKHKESKDTLTIFKQNNHCYVAHPVNLKWVLVVEVEEYMYGTHKAFMPIECPLGERAESYYRIVDGRLVERPCDGSGADYWYEPI